MWKRELPRWVNYYFRTLKLLLSFHAEVEQREDHVRLHVVFARIVFKDVQSLQKALEAATGRVSHAVLPPPASVLKECVRARKSFYPATCVERFSAFSAHCCAT